MTMLKPGSVKLYPSFWFAAKTFIFLKAPIIFRAEFAFFFVYSKLLKAGSRATWSKYKLGAIFLSEMSVIRLHAQTRQKGIEGKTDDISDYTTFWRVKPDGLAVWHEYLS